MRNKSEPGDRIGELYDRMLDDDSALGGLDEKRVKAVTGLPWAILPSEETTDAQEIADTCAEMLDAVTGLGTNLAHQLGAVPRGCAIEENIWHPQASRRGRLTGKWIPAEIIDRPLHRFAFKDGELRVRQKDGTLKAYPAGRFIVGTYGTKDIRWGKPLCDRVYWPFYMTIHFVKYAGVAGEKFGQPTVLVKYKRNLTDEKLNQEEIEKALAAGRDFQTEYAIAIPEDIELELKEAARSGLFTYGEMLQLLDRWKALVWLGEIDTSGMSPGPGSFARNRVSNEVRYETIVADATWLAELLTDQLLRPFVWANYGVEAPMPYWWFDVEEASDRKLRQEAAAAVLDAGEDIPLSYYRRLHQIPAPRRGEPVVSGRKKTAARPVAAPPQLPPGNEDEEPEAPSVAAAAHWSHVELRGAA